MDFLPLKEYIDRLVSEYKVPGADCIVCMNNKEVFRYYSGMSDKENKVPMSGNELYLIYSMTKMLTCTCALQLLEKGKYTLDDTLDRYMPEFTKLRISSQDFNTSDASKITTGVQAGEKENTHSDVYALTPVTIRHLFTMSGGFNYDLDADYIHDAINSGKVSTRDIVASLSSTVLGFEPGTRFRYSLCHDILGALVEIWSGKTLGEYMQENIFVPLGMKNTFFGVDSKREDEYAARYIYAKDGNVERLPLECVFNFTDKYQSGGAGLTSTTEDYSLFLDALASGGVGRSGKRILSPHTIALMSTNHLNDAQYRDFQMLRPGYGYGLGVRTHVDPTASGSLSPVGEFGWDGAAGAFSMVDTKNALSLTYFQHIHAWQLRIQTEMRNILYSCIV